MIQRKYTFLTGILAGLVIAIGTASAFSFMATQTFGQANNNNSPSDSQNQASSQMMQGGSNDGMSTSQMQNNQSDMQSDGTDMGSSMMNGMSFFSGEGVSMVDNVKVIGVSISGGNEISVSLRYSGNGTAPGVTVAAITQSMENMMMPMSMMESDNSGNMMSNGMMQGHGSVAASDENSSLGSMPQKMGEAIHSGSNILNSGWNSPSTIIVKIQGNTTSDDDHVMVMVFPYLK